MLVQAFDPFSNRKPEEILGEKLSLFPEYHKDIRFHLLMGRCMLKIGRLEEAYAAFQYAERIAPETQTIKLFMVITLTMAHRYKEAEEKAEAIRLENLDGAELVSMLDIYQRLGKNLKPIFPAFDHLPPSTRASMFLVYRDLFAKGKKSAKKRLDELNPADFTEKDGGIITYFHFLADMYKMQIGVHASITKLRESMPLIGSWGSEEAMECLKTWYGTHAFEHIAKGKQKKLALEFIEHFPEDREVQAMAYGMLWKAQQDESSWKKILGLAEEGNEHALLLAVEQRMHDFDDTKAGELYANLKSLVQADQQNMLYRKYFYEFLLQIGNVDGANTVNKASMQVRLQQEKKQFDLIVKFRRCYQMEKECPICHGKNSEDCPLCMGTGYMPIIRTAAFNTSPNPVLCLHPEVRYATADSEEEMRAMLDWSPMNVPSQIAGRYFLSCGAYPSDIPFPDVLVPGQTYIFLKLKEEAYQRLADKGYSLAQIDPLLTVLMSYKKMRLKIPFSKNGKKEISQNLLNAGDFDIEITRATDKG